MHNLEKGNKAIICIGGTSRKYRVEVIGKRDKHVLLKPLEKGDYGLPNGALTKKNAEDFGVDESHVGCRYGIYYADAPEVQTESYDWVPPTSIAR